jgi:hypothetical protein
MNSLIYYVKREVGLFRKGGWIVLMDKMLIGTYPQRETALAAAVSEADRSSTLGRVTEVWAYEGDGFVLHKAFQAKKGKNKEKDDEVDLEDDSAFIVDDDPTVDSGSY